MPVVAEKLAFGKPRRAALACFVAALVLLPALPFTLLATAWFGVNDVPCFGGSFAAGSHWTPPFRYFVVQTDHEEIEIWQWHVGRFWWSWSRSLPRPRLQLRATPSAIRAQL